jgi:hypothetical protein
VGAIKITVPDRVISDGLAREVLRGLGDPVADSRRRKPLKDTAIDYLKACRVRAVILDNLQDLPLRRGSRGVDQVAVQLRDFIDESQSLWIMFGTELALKVLHAEAQLVKRVPWVSRMPYFSPRSEASRRDFGRLVVALDKWIPTTGASCLSDKAHLSRFMIASNGVIDRLIRLAEAATDRCREEGREEVSLTDFENAYDDLFGGLASANPFADSVLDIRPRSRPDEPYYALRNANLEAAQKS